jgi:hypothetical protein
LKVAKIGFRGLFLGLIETTESASAFSLTPQTFQKDFYGEHYLPVGKNDVEIFVWLSLFH